MNSSQQQRKRFQKEYLIPLIAAASLIAACIIVSSKKCYWNDELYSYYLLSDQFFAHMLSAFHNRINNAPPLYFVAEWLWAKGLGASELSLRLFSSLGVCAALTAIWVALRKVYGFWAATIGVATVFCVSGTILNQNAEARMYGLFLAVCSFGILLPLVAGKLAIFSRRLFLLNLIIHIAIVQTHLFGLFYSASIVIALAIRDRCFRTFQLKYYLSIVAAWLTLIFYIPSFLAQADAGNPRSWLPIPSLRELIGSLALSQSNLIRMIQCLAFIVGLLFLHQVSSGLHSKRLEKNSPSLQSKVFLIGLSCAFLAVPILTWCVSRTVKPIFYDRYVIPSLIVWSILLAHLISFVTAFKFSNDKLNNYHFLKSISLKWGQIALLVAIIALLVHPVFYAMSFPREQVPGANDNRYGNEQLSIVVQDSHDFTQRLYYSAHRDRYAFILDWQSAVDRRSGLFGPQEYKHLITLKHVYPQISGQTVVESQAFLNTHPRFLVLDSLNYTKECSSENRLSDIHCPQWLETRIIANPAYKLTQLGEVDERLLLLVETTK